MVRLNGLVGSAFSFFVRMFNYYYYYLILAPKAIACRILFRHFEPLNAYSSITRRHFPKISIFKFCHLPFVDIVYFVYVNFDLIRNISSGANHTQCPNDNAYIRFYRLHTYLSSIVVVIIAAAVVDKYAYHVSICSLFPEFATSW